MAIQLPGVRLQSRYNWDFTCPSCEKGVAAREAKLCAFLTHEILFAQCPMCEAETTWLHEITHRPADPMIVSGDATREERRTAWRLIYPVHPIGLRKFPNCPTQIYQDYQEARLTLASSSRGAAALARRALQSILHHKGIKGPSLASEIEAVLQSTDPSQMLPGYLATTVDLIRAHGNFAAHPIEDKDTGVMLPVEADEAEHCVLVVEELIDFYFERPKIAENHRAAANAKLARAGKAGLKGGA